MEYNKLLADMVPGDRVEGFYILKEGAIKTSNSGKPFLSATVTDKSGSLDLKAWDYSGPVGAPTDAGKVVKIRADVTEYRGSIQLTASNIRMATQEADHVVVVTTTDVTALRDAQRTVMELDRFPRGRLHLVVNRVRGKLLRSMHATIDDAIDTAGLPLLGVVPEDDALPLAQSRGTALLLVSHTGASAAYRNIAKRITGQRVPLLRLR